MKNYLLLFGILGLFFFLGTATSPERNFEEYPCTVVATTEAIILTSQSEIPITAASLTLSTDSITVDSLSNFHIIDYDLSAHATDTILFSEFTFLDSIPFPTGVVPMTFSLGFFANETNFFKRQNF